MPLATLAVTLWLAAGPEGARPLKLASPGLTVLNVDPKVGGFYTEHVAQQLKLIGVEIITVREIESLLGMERQRELLGCSTEASSCIAELANALGADGVLLGDIARLGARYTVNLKVIGAESGKTLAVYSENASSEDEVTDTLTRGAKRLAIDASAALGRAPPHIESGGVPLRKVAIAPLALGVAALGLGVGLVVWSNNDYSTLSTGTGVKNGPAIASRGATTGPLGVASMVVGGVAIAAGVVMYLLGGESTPKVTVSAGAQGAALLFSGDLP